MTEKTIKELAEELGVSKTAINKKVSDENRKLWFSKIGNKFVINETGQKAIKSMFFNENENSNQQLVGEKTKTETHKNANQQIEKLQEQLQLTYTEESSENKSTTLSEETESIEKQSKTEKKWWQFWQ